MTQTTPQAIQVSAALDVQEVERELNRLWKETAAVPGATDDERAVLRARVLNLMVYVTDEASLREVNEILARVTLSHPCRALVMLAEADVPDRDIEMYVSAHCPESSGMDERQLCCEQVTLTARGSFTVELPSAATPLFVPDLPIFLWWRDAPRLTDKTFLSLASAADRVIIDSADFPRPYDDLINLREFLRRGRTDETRLSDLNWARLTSWRTLLASFYDVGEYRATLEKITRVRIEYVAHSASPPSVAPKALILAGWLASRLGWHVVPEQASVVAADEDNVEESSEGAHLIRVEKEGRSLSFEFQSVSRQESMQGWIARVELKAEEGGQASFVVLRSESGDHLETAATVDGETRGARVLMGGVHDESELLSRELAILSYDSIYEQAVGAAADMLIAAALRA